MTTTLSPRDRAPPPLRRDRPAPPRRSRGAAREGCIVQQCGRGDRSRVLHRGSSATRGTRLRRRRRSAVSRSRGHAEAKARDARRAHRSFSNARRSKAPAHSFFGTRSSRRDQHRAARRLAGGRARIAATFSAWLRRVWPRRVRLPASERERSIARRVP